MKIVVVGLGYVGMSNAVLLAQHNEVIGVDIAQERVDALNARKSPIIDAELSEYLAEKDLNLSASTDLESSVGDADYVIISTPTNYDEKTNFFDTSSVETVIAKIIAKEPNTCIVVKSTIPVGFIEDVRERLDTDAVIFSPEFLREGKALYDNLHPSRIIVGEKSERAAAFARLLSQGAIKSDVDVLFTGASEAEAIKLFSNTYLAMRVAFFNELDNYSLASNMNSRDIINGITLDKRIGNEYRNPSFGYGGYCLPKDTKQLLEQFRGIPQSLISAIPKSNNLRKEFIVEYLLNKSFKTIGIYKIAMKAGSDNSRESATLDVAKRLQHNKQAIILYDPLQTSPGKHGLPTVSTFEEFCDQADLIVTNRIDSTLSQVKNIEIFSADQYGTD